MLLLASKEEVGDCTVAPCCCCRRFRRLHLFSLYLFLFGYSWPCESASWIDLDSTSTPGRNRKQKKRGKINIADQEMVWVVVALNSSRDHKTQNPTREKRSLCCATGQFSAIISHFLHLKSLLGGALTPTPTPKRWPANVHPDGSLSVSCCFSSNSAEKCVHTRREKKKKGKTPRARNSAGPRGPTRSNRIFHLNARWLSTVLTSTLLVYSRINRTPLALSVLWVWLLPMRGWYWWEQNIVARLLYVKLVL